MEQPGQLKVYMPSQHPIKGQHARPRVIFQARVDGRNAAAALAREWATANPELSRCGSFAVFCADPDYV